MPKIAPPSARTAINRAEARPFSRKPLLPPAAPNVTAPIRQVPATILLQRMDIATQLPATNLPLGQTTPYVIENKSLTATWKTPIATAATQTQTANCPLGQTTPYIIENKPLAAARKTSTGSIITQTQQATFFLRQSTPHTAENTPLPATLKTLTPAACVTTPTPCREIQQTTGATPHPRTLNRPLFHNCAISLNIRDSDINGAISNFNHINASGSSRLILWCWPFSCNPSNCRPPNCEPK